MVDILLGLGDRAEVVRVAEDLDPEPVLREFEMHLDEAMHATRLDRPRGRRPHGWHPRRRLEAAGERGLGGRGRSAAAGHRLALVVEALLVRAQRLSRPR